MQKELNVWFGLNALKRFLMLENYPVTPMVELPPILNPFHADNVRIFAKLMFLMPLLNSKMIPALKMLQTAQHDGKLEGVDTLVENSSGNTGLSLAAMAWAFDITKPVELIVPRDIAPNKEKMLVIAGANVRKMEKDAKETGIEKARRLGQQEGWYCTEQYDNPANVQGHIEITATQIWEQLSLMGLSGGPCLVSVGEGSGGHALGCEEYLKNKNPGFKIIGVIPPNEDDAIPGTRSFARLKETTLGGEDVDFLVTVSPKKAYDSSNELCVKGVFGGPSSGAARAALHNIIGREKKEGRLEGLRNKNGEVVGVFLCPDTPFLYTEKYGA